MRALSKIADDASQWQALVGHVVALTLSVDNFTVPTNLRGWTDVGPEAAVMRTGD